MTRRNAPILSWPRALVLALCVPLTVVPADGSSSAVPSGVVFHEDTLFRSTGRGDNWCLTWAADGSQVTSMDDGSWLGTAPQFHNHLYRIVGGPDGFGIEDLPGYPRYVRGEGSWFGYGVLSVEGVLYSAVSKTPRNSWSGPFRGFKLLASDDGGRTWSRVDREGRRRPIGSRDPAMNAVDENEMFFLEEHGIVREEQVAYPFSFVSFIQHGRDHGASRDGYVYVHAPEGAQAHRLLLARVREDRLGHREAWEYFAGHEGEGAVWSSDIRERSAVHVFPERNEDGHFFGWYSWLPSVVWNEGLGLYVMVNGGTYGGHGMSESDEDYFHRWMHTRTGSLGFWYAERPWGPWQQFYYTDYWTVDDSANRTYQPKLSPKWISADGRKMVLIWSDAMEDAEGRSHSVNYKWNQMEITIEVEDAIE